MRQALKDTRTGKVGRTEDRGRRTDSAGLPLAMALAGVLLAILGCAKKESAQTTESPRELVLYCGAGIRPPIAELIDLFSQTHDVTITPDYAGSEVLLSKIKIARRGDLYLPGDKHYVDLAAAETMITTRHPVFYWVPTLLVQKGNPKQITSLQDLKRPGLRLGIGDPKACAIGRKTLKLLQKNGITLEQLTDQLTFQALTVDPLGMQIQAQSLDAVVVWDATAQYYHEHGTEVPIPLENNIISSVDIGVLSFTKNVALAQQFADFLISEQAIGVFKKHNYTTEPPADGTQ